MDNFYNISFMAKPGAEVMRRAAHECNGNKARIMKFKKLFEDAFVKNLDENTVVDIDKNNQFIFSHLKFPNIFYKSDKNLDTERGTDFLSAMIMACPTTLSSIEHKMIRTIIAEYVKTGTSLNEIRQIVETNIKNEEVKKYFLDNLNIAHRIKENNPDANLTLGEFDEMEMTIFNELAKTPGTCEYKMIHDNIIITC